MREQKETQDDLNEDEKMLKKLTLKIKMHRKSCDHESVMR